MPLGRVIEPQSRVPFSFRSLAVVASLLAGLWPAARFAKMRPAAALRDS